ncbi:hypothetical protein Tco_0476243 [Tanacetum coccineum]
MPFMTECGDLAKAFLGKTVCTCNVIRKAEYVALSAKLCSCINAWIFMYLYLYGNNLVCMNGLTSPNHAACLDKAFFIDSFLETFLNKLPPKPTALSKQFWNFKDGGILSEASLSCSPYLEMFLSCSTIFVPQTKHSLLSSDQKPV